MNKQEYNGWTNYETWAVNLWMDNAEGSQRHYAEKAQEAYDNAKACRVFTRKERATSDLADVLKDEHEEAAEALEGVNGTVFADLLGAAMSEVDWYSIAEHLMAEVTEEAEGAEA